VAAADMPAHLRRAQWRRLGKTLGLAFLLPGIVFSGILLYAGTWPAFIAVGSASMQHDDNASAFGVMDVGDVVLIQAISSPDELVTYVEGRATGYATYGDFGDVVILRDLDVVVNQGLVLHRALTSVVWNITACLTCYDVPELRLLDNSEWDAWNATGNATGIPTDEPLGLVRFVLRDAGWRQDREIDFRMWEIRLRVSGAGILTLGDNNLYPEPTGFDKWIVPLSEVVGVARGEIPWFGLVPLTLFPEPLRCCAAWGSTDPDLGAPANSWRSLEIALIAIVGSCAGAYAASSYVDRRRRRARVKETVG